MYKSKLLPLHGAFLPNIKYFVSKTAMQFNNTPLVVEQSNYAAKILNASIVYDLDNRRKIPLEHFTSKNYFFGTSTIVKISDKGKGVCSGYSNRLNSI